jgi:hypothetical protein
MFFEELKYYRKIAVVPMFCRLISRVKMSGKIMYGRNLFLASFIEQIKKFGSLFVSRQMRSYVVLALFYLVKMALTALAYDLSFVYGLQEKHQFVKILPKVDVVKESNNSRILAAVRAVSYESF